MIRRHRYVFALVCLAALTLALALPDVAQTFVWTSEPVATIAPASERASRVTDREHRPSAAAVRSALAPRAPPLA